MLVGSRPCCGLKLFGQLGGAGLDRRAPRGPVVEKFGAHPDDFAHRAFGAPGRCGFGEPQPQRCEVGLDAGVVQLGGGHGDAV